ncbi:MAG: hypothetical protein A3H51_00775 [Candidatus Spechtbacteria bacterium RIFCSPLOWO2_02_FULL_38_8]|uniref:Amino acid transporter transmembrane domain-containing protein n=1 Tax=Candidatus Spechtbacteria bacterium RIFCSPLOWO2_02_FULL_38_8 TaxID=1802164 RepID=A0A1G2HJ96_9BACT|nr:MAG: hypothetical protein A3H51_00775 [Candidatus Spechtbacteria bacterium RIFCSPLOWO2_02_FULL_38_8]
MNKDFIKATSSLVGAIVGAGIFGVPFVMAQAGFFVGFAYFAALGVIMLVLHLMYGEVVEHTEGQHRLMGYSKIYLGSKASKLVSVSVVISMFGSLIVYILLASDFFNTILPDVFSYDFAWGFLFWGILGIGIIKGLKTIAKMEVFMMALLMLVMFAIVLKGIPVINMQNYFTLDWSRAFLPYGVILFSLGGFAAIPEMRASIKSDSLTFRKSIVAGVIISTVVTFLFGAVVLGVSGQTTSIDAIGGLLPYLGKIVVYLGSIFGILAIATSYLIIGVSFKESFIYDWKVKKSISNSLVIFVPMMAIMLGIKSFIIVLGFVGAVLGAVDGSVIAVLFLKARSRGVSIPHLPVNFSKTLVVFIISVLIAGGMYATFNLLV